jgi:DNA-binding MarR family transcriptional regulator
MFTLRSLPDKDQLADFAHRFPSVDLEALEACLFFLRTAADVSEAFGMHFARFGLSEGKFTILMLLFENFQSGLSPSDCADRAGVTRGTITGLLDGLEREELVLRQAHQSDRRMITVHLTDKGLKFLEAMLPEHFRRTAGLFGQTSEAERKALIALLYRLRSGIPALRDP